MHKKLEAELISLAHSILQMKNKEDVNTLHKKARKIYEKLSVLKFVDTYMNTTSTTSEIKEEIIDKKVIATIANEKIATATKLVEEIKEEEINVENGITKREEKETPLAQISLEEELKDAISADEATQLFEKVTKKNPVIKENIKIEKRSLNDALFKNNLQVGLNDRIAFVKHLFDGSQEDFNRVVSQLNTFKTEKEAKNFIAKMVKPDYDWSLKEEYEERLTNLIERKFS